MGRESVNSQSSTTGYIQYCCPDRPGPGKRSEVSAAHFSEAQVSFILVIELGKVCHILTCTFEPVVLHTRIRVCPSDQNSLGDQLFVYVAIVGHHKSERAKFVPIYFNLRLTHIHHGCCSTNPSCQASMMEKSLAVTHSHSARTPLVQQVTSAYALQSLFFFQS